MKLPIKRHLKKVLPLLLILISLLSYSASAKTIFELANDIIKDVYEKVAGLSTVLAGLMTAVAVIGAKISNNQQKVDQAWDWLKRVWIAWAIINSVGALLAYVVPLFQGYNTLTY